MRLRLVFLAASVLGVSLAGGLVMPACSSSPMSQCLDACQKAATCSAVPVMLDCSTSCTTAIDEAAAKGCTGQLDAVLSCDASLGCGPSNACLEPNSAYQACIGNTTSTGTSSSSASSSGDTGAGGGAGTGGGPTVGSSSSSSSGSNGNWGCGTQDDYCYCDTQSSGLDDKSCTPGWSCCRAVSDDTGSFCQCTNDEGSACDSAWSSYPTATSVSNCPP